MVHPVSGGSFFRFWNLTTSCLPYFNSIPQSIHQSIKAESSLPNDFIFRSRIFFLGNPVLSHLLNNWRFSTCPIIAILQFSSWEFCSSLNQIDILHIIWLNEHYLSNIKLRVVTAFVCVCSTFYSFYKKAHVGYC